MPARARPRNVSNPWPRFPGPVIRMFLLASLSVLACIWGLVRYYAHQRAVLQGVPAVPAAVDAGEIPAPDLETTP